MNRILVLDDDAKLNKTVCTYLNDCGFEAVGVLDVQAAFDAMYNELFDAIVSDIMMPGMDGFAFAQSVRQVNKHIPSCSCLQSPQTGSVYRGKDRGALRPVRKRTGTAVKGQSTRSKRMRISSCQPE